MLQMSTNKLADAQTVVRLWKLLIQLLCSSESLWCRIRAYWSAGNRRSSCKTALSHFLASSYMLGVLWKGFLVLIWLIWCSTSSTTFHQVEKANLLVVSEPLEHAIMCCRVPAAKYSNSRAFDCDTEWTRDVTCFQSRYGAILSMVTLVI